jgi:hypothetical protein
VATPPFDAAPVWGMIDAMWSNGRVVGITRITGLGASVAVVGLLAGCGNGQSPTEAARLAESRRLEAEQAKAPDRVDAMFLGTGPAIPRDGFTECPLQGVWSGYPRGTTLRMRAHVPGSVQAALAGAVTALTGATMGALTILLETTPEPDPQPRVNEVTVAEVASPRAAGCPSDAGCVQYRFAGRGLLMGARVVSPPGRSAGGYVHDVGHGVLGLCHIDARQIGGAENSVMSGGPGVGPGDGAPTFTSLDLEAIRLVYSSNVNPGASRSAFLAARLVNLQAGQLPRSR